jgi:hypothetical protein
MTEFRGKRAGFFRPKPVRKVGKVCPRCGKFGHIGTTTCDVKTIEGIRPLSSALPNVKDLILWPKSNN